MRRWLGSTAVLTAGMAAFAVLISCLSVVVVIALFRSDDAIREIQQSRLDFCRQQNARHDGTVRVLDRQIQHFPPRARMRAIRQRAGTVALIDALAPKRNCVRAIPPRP